MMRICTLLIILLASATSSILSQDGLQIGDYIRDYELFDYQSKLHTLYENKGNVVVLTFWKPGDENSELLLKGLEDVHQKYVDQAVRVIAIDMYSQTTDALMFVSRAHLSYQFLQGMFQKLVDDYQLQGVPVTYVLDPEMKVAMIYNGFDESTITKIFSLIERKLPE